MKDLWENFRFNWQYEDSIGKTLLVLMLLGVLGGSASLVVYTTAYLFP